MRLRKRRSCGFSVWTCSCSPEGHPGYCYSSSLQKSPKPITEAAPPETTARVPHRTDFWSVILNALIMTVIVNHAVKVRERSLTTCTGDFIFYTVFGQDSVSLAFF